MSNVVFLEKQKPCCAYEIWNVSRYILPCCQRNKQDNAACIGCVALILIIKEVRCLLLVHVRTVLPLLMAWLCASQPLRLIVPIPWHLGDCMMQRQPWWWSQLWCNAVMQQQGYFRSTSKPPRPPSASMPPWPSLSQHLICHKVDSHIRTGTHRIY